MSLFNIDFNETYWDNLDAATNDVFAMRRSVSANQRIDITDISWGYMAFEDMDVDFANGTLMIIRGDVDPSFAFVGGVIPNAAGFKVIWADNVNFSTGLNQVRDFNKPLELTTGYTYWIVMTALTEVGGGTPLGTIASYITVNAEIKSDLPRISLR